MTAGCDPFEELVWDLDWAEEAYYRVIAGWLGALANDLIDGTLTVEDVLQQVLQQIESVK